MSGYHWLRTKEFPNEREDLFLTPEQPGSQEAQSYRPLEAEPALFRIFADTEPTRDGIQEFANEYGPLSMFGGATARRIYVPHYKVVRREKPEAGGETAPKSALRIGSRNERTEIPDGVGETFSDWANAIRTMKDAVSLSEGLRLRDMERIANTLEAQDFAPQFFVPRRELPKNPIEIASQAQSCLQYLISRALSRQLSIELTEGLHVTLSDLLPTLWVQFAIALDDSTEFRRCIQCAKWFAAANSGNQIERIYCSNGCRTRAYRVRKNEQPIDIAGGTELTTEVWSLYTEGLWLDEIAKRLGIEPVFVRKAIQREAQEGH